MSEYVEFSVDHEAQLERLRALVVALQSEKRGETQRSTVELEALFGPDLLERFERPSAAARARRREELRSRPVVELPTERAVGTRWDFDSMIHAIMEGDYDLLGCDRVGERRARLTFVANGHPYGGVGALVALVEALGMRVTGIQDGTGYIAIPPAGR
jgi:hypothetical protein